MSCSEAIKLASDLAVQEMAEEAKRKQEEEEQEAQAARERAQQEASTQKARQHGQKQNKQSNAESKKPVPSTPASRQPPPAASATDIERLLDGTFRPGAPGWGYSAFQSGASRTGAEDFPVSGNSSNESGKNRASVIPDGLGGAYDDESGGDVLKPRPAQRPVSGQLAGGSPASVAPGDSGLVNQQAIEEARNWLESRHPELKHDFQYQIVRSTENYGRTDFGTHTIYLDRSNIDSMVQLVETMAHESMHVTTQGSDWAAKLGHYDGQHWDIHAAAAAIGAEFAKESGNQVPWGIEGKSGTLWEMPEGIKFPGWKSPK